MTPYFGMGTMAIWRITMRIWQRLRKCVSSDVHMAKVARAREYAEVVEDANWRSAMEEQMRALTENETWDLVDAPKGVKSIRCRWV